jgi:hypothetical protein
MAWRLSPAADIHYRSLFASCFLKHGCNPHHFVRLGITRKPIRTSNHYDNEVIAISAVIRLAFWFVESPQVLRPLSVMLFPHELHSVSAVPLRLVHRAVSFRYQRG